MAIRKIVSVTLLAFASMAASASVFAADNTEGTYLGGAAGKSKDRQFCDGTAGTGISCSDTDTAGKLIAGYQFDRNWAFEASFVDLGKITGSDSTFSIEVKTKAFTMAAIGFIPLGNRFALFGKIGGYDAETKGNATLNGQAFRVEDSNTNFLYGIGAKLDFTRNLGMRVEYERFQNVGNDETVGESDMDFLSVGLTYKF